MRTVQCAEADVPAALRARVWALQQQAWPGDEPDPGLSHDPALRPWSMLLLDGEQLPPGAPVRLQPRPDRAPPRRRRPALVTPLRSACGTGPQA
jgi:hypothetical protein